LEEQSKFCTNCGAKVQFQSIGGWLILVGISIILSPFILVAKLFPMYKDLLKPGVWELLTTSGIQYYSTFIFFEMLINFLIFLTWGYLIYLFFEKKKIFRKLYLGILIFIPIFIVIDALVAQQIMGLDKLFEFNEIKEIFKSILYLAIWGTYISISERAKRTFVN
jgi:flagellar biosynthesis protein FliP